jgi:uncharacterized protein YraI
MTSQYRRLLAYTSTSILLSALLTTNSALSSAAEPDTPVRYPEGSSAHRAEGPGFDTCTAPSLEALKAWKASEYTTVNVYFGGINRSCDQPQLNRTWVQQATAMGWDLLPTYVGRQPACVHGKMHTFSGSDAASAGRSDADDAVGKAQDLGLLPGSALYADVEHYNHSDEACRSAVRQYVSEWTKTLHAHGYLAGVYVHHASGLRDLTSGYGSASAARPDAIWMAQWDGQPSLRAWPGAPDDHWAGHQRIKQYRGDHDATWGGVTLNIDSNVLDAPVATVARSHEVTSSTPLNGRSGPATAHEVLHRYSPGSSVSVVCQADGQTIGSTSAWNLLTNGSWVSDHYVSTPNPDSSAAVPRCSYPGQVNSGIPLNARSGPGTSYGLSGAPLPDGSLAWVACQAKGADVFGTPIWNKLTDGRWVSDYYVSTRAASGWTAPIPRCS